MISTSFTNKRTNERSMHYCSINSTTAHISHNQTDTTNSVMTMPGLMMFPQNPSQVPILISHLGHIRGRKCRQRTEGPRFWKRLDQTTDPIVQRPFDMTRRLEIPNGVLYHHGQVGLGDILRMQNGRLLLLPAAWWRSGVAIVLRLHSIHIRLLLRRRLNEKARSRRLNGRLLSPTLKQLDGIGCLICQTHNISSSSIVTGRCCCCSHWRLPSRTLFKPAASCKHDNNHTAH